MVVEGCSGRTYNIDEKCKTCDHMSENSYSASCDISGYMCISERADERVCGKDAIAWIPSPNHFSPEEIAGFAQEKRIQKPIYRFVRFIVDLIGD